MPAGGAPDFFGVFAPCFTCPKESHAAAKVCRHMAANNAAMLRFDVTGLGESEGSFAETNFTTRIKDILAACAALAHDYAPVKLLVGHSIGGTAALSAALALPGLQAVATIGAPRDPAWVMNRFLQQNLVAQRSDGDIDITVIGKRVRFRKSFVEDMMNATAAADTERLGKKLFIFHAPHDDIVSMENAHAIYGRAINADRELVVLSDAATHLFENRKDDAEFVAETLLDWFRTHLR